MPPVAARELRLGTRGSQLALWQANAVAARLQETGGPPCRIVVIKTSGDRLQEAPLSEIGGKRLFVKEIEDALLRDEIDLAVHSSKDMPAILPDGLIVGAVLAREDPFDAIVLPESVRLKPDTTDGSLKADTTQTVRLKADTAKNEGGKADPTYETGDGSSDVVSGFSRIFGDVVAALGESPTLGTSSVRRIAQLTRVFPRAVFAPVRGNLDTRLRKLDSGAYGGLVLAAAGLRRLGTASRISALLPASVCIPAPGQGIIAIEIPKHDPALADRVRAVDDAAAHAALDAERAVVRALGGGCQTPVGALASPLANQDLELVAVVVSLDGRRAVYGKARGKQHEATTLGASVGAQLLAEGAGDILAEADRSRGAVQGIQP